ncbi:hypothetical protein EYF80_036217 [Liparis tanakae]|uniref:Uncharacterized protein n=1 Tax=Liparis tanakae TaxID=230148 RepID=A0A4Z2GLA0_9TELE|nr:hypothetical protein EYF80_036217 [Liparis tanakae]
MSSVNDRRSEAPPLSALSPAPSPHFRGSSAASRCFLTGRKWISEPTFFSLMVLFFFFCGSSGSCCSPCAATGTPYSCCRDAAAAAAWPPSRLMEKFLVETPERPLIFPQRTAGMASFTETMTLAASGSPAALCWPRAPDPPAAPGRGGGGRDNGDPGLLAPFLPTSSGLQLGSVGVDEGVIPGRLMGKGDDP